MKIDAEDGVGLATELTKVASVSLTTIKSANLVERVGIMEKEIQELKDKIKRLEGRTTTYVVMEQEEKPETEGEK